MTNSGLPEDGSNRPKWARFRNSKENPKTVRKLFKNPIVSFLVDIVTIVATALVLSLLIKTFLIRSFYVPSGSMLNTLQINDRIVVNELVPNVVPIERGDVVVFKDPGGWLGVIDTKPVPWTTQVSDWFLGAFGITAPDSDQHLVKRVIGVAGDHIVCCDAHKKITINGKEITEPYIADNQDPSTMKFNVTVPADSIWVMGDNRGNSEDSRYHGDLPSKGFVNKKFIVGRAFIISWPFNHFTWLDNYPNVFKDVPNPKN
jgi:signal peptidase I